ncbi:DeoR/GlpR family DNA-binding transcription regulator [Crossiella sp. NPDC003009]
MDAEQRRRWLVAAARAEGRVEVTAAAAVLDTAPETIRRDLALLEKHGLLHRVHGGARPVERAGYEIELATREHRRLAEKQRIARAALDQLGDAESVYLDEGSTGRALADAFPADRRCTVVTSALPTATALATGTAATVLVLGGRLRGNTLATVDHWATRMLADLVLDVVFLGANGISREHGLTTPDPAVAAIKSKALARAGRKILIADHTKFGVNSFCRFADVADFDVIVTDTGLPAAQARRYSLLGPEVVRA